MYCKKCGSLLVDGDNFCRNCGSQIDKNNSVENNVELLVDHNDSVIDNNDNKGTVNIPIADVKKSTNNGFKYVFLASFFIILLGFLFLMFNFTRYAKYNVESKVSGSSSDSSENVSKTSNSLYKVKFEGFTLGIPDSLTYEEESGIIYVGDSNDSWSAGLEIKEGSYSSLLSKKSQFPTILSQGGYECHNILEKEVNGVKFLTIQISRSGINSILAFTKLNSTYVMGLTICNRDNTYDYSVLGDISNVVLNTKVDSVSNSITTDSKIDTNSIEELLK